MKTCLTNDDASVAPYERSTRVEWSIHSSLLLLRKNEFPLAHFTLKICRLPMKPLCVVVCKIVLPCPDFSFADVILLEVLSLRFLFKYVSE